jgi:mycothiol synthase
LSTWRTQLNTHGVPATLVGSRSVETEALPDASWTARVPTPEDAEAIARLENAVTVAEAGIPFATTERVRDVLTSPIRGACRDTAVFDAEGAALGYNDVRGAAEDGVHVLTFADPSVWGRGLSAWLIADAERAAAERWPSGVPVRLSCYGGNERAIRLFEALGYYRVRVFWSMAVDLAEPPPAPVLDAGITIRIFDRERDERAVYGALLEAFEDHWGEEFPTFERWVHEDIEGEGSRFDPSLWFLALEGDGVVGAATCSSGSAQDEEAGAIRLLGVRRAWRRRGVALALVLTAFGEFHRRGIPRAQLGVDSTSPTGATRLYERAGMRSIRSWEVWEKRVGSVDEPDGPSLNAIERR